MGGFFSSMAANTSTKPCGSGVRILQAQSDDLHGSGVLGEEGRIVAVEHEYGPIISAKWRRE
jgi:hypothetical protein